METVTDRSATVVIPTLGNHDVVWQTLDHLFRTELEGADVVIVYNGWEENGENFRQRLNREFPRARWVRTPTPYGIARANNLGAQVGEGRYVAYLHDDVLIDDPRWLSTLIGVLERHPEVGMVGGSEPKFVDRSRARMEELEPGVMECDWSPTISIARRGHEAFDEFYLVGLEDKDWALTFRRQGRKVVCRRVDHRHVGTKGSYALFLQDRALLDYYSKEGVRERHFLAKNKDVLSADYLCLGWKKWGRWDRDWKKVWWMKLYLRYLLCGWKYQPRIFGRVKADPSSGQTR